MPSPETTLRPPQNPKPTPRNPPQEHPHQKCPRCNSSNTKFCYYNNYSLTQPRHFCKTCRRYWTRGGALRNVPLGGGSRKSAKKSLKTTSSKFIPGPGLGPDCGPGPAQYNTTGPNAQLISTTTSGFGPGDGPYFGLGLMGLSGNDHQHHISITSIESLSSINQEMHWKLQQQRLAMIYGTTSSHNHQVTKIYNNTNININNSDLQATSSCVGNNYGVNNTNNYDNIVTSISMGSVTTTYSSCDNVNDVITRDNNMHGWGDLLDNNSRHNDHNNVYDDQHSEQQQQQQIIQFNGLQ
ncbi:hypothetical protein vseg_015520 [Gypsophila vaccaria]